MSNPDTYLVLLEKDEGLERVIIKGKSLFLFHGPWREKGVGLAEALAALRERESQLLSQRKKVNKELRQIAELLEELEGTSNDSNVDNNSEASRPMQFVRDSADATDQ